MRNYPPLHHKSLASVSSVLGLQERTSIPGFQVFFKNSEYIIGKRQDKYKKKRHLQT